jgi:TonB family protein
MSGVFMDKGMRIIFLLSLAGHLLLLGIPFEMRLDSRIEESKDLEIVYVEMKKPPLLPRIDVMSSEKKLKAEGKFLETVEKEKKQNAEAETKLQSEEIIAEVLLEQPIEEEVKVIDPAQEAMLRYQDMVKQRIEEVRRYPYWAKKQGIQGTTFVNFLVLSNGSSQDIEIIRPSGSKILDEETIATIKRANPFPPIPKETHASFVRMEVSIVFKLN